ncbi:MAG: serine hydrolase [Caldilineaceae bacterium]
MSSITTLPRSTPEAQGISSSAISAFVNEVNESIQYLNSFMLLRHGSVVAEGWWAPYAPESPHMLFSLSKSFTSTAIGLAVHEGLLTVDDLVLGFFPEDAPAQPSANLAAMRVRDLLAMATGHAEDTTGHLHQRQDGNWVAAFLAQPVVYPPGTYFLYNSGATYMLSAIVQKLTGMTVLEYLRPRLFTPLGIEKATWENCPRGINVGGWGLSITTDSIARFGQLYLQKGRWGDQQLIPQAWVEEATAAHSDNSREKNPDWQQGYGYQFWRCRHNAYRGDGAFGQYCIVMPELDAVLAITSGLGDMQAVLNLVWKHLLPVMKPGSLAADASAQARLREHLAQLSIPPVEGAKSSPVAAQQSGRTFTLPANEQQIESLRFDFADTRSTLILQTKNGVERLVCGQGGWQLGRTHLERNQDLAVAVSGGWSSPDTYAIKLCFYETPFTVTVLCRFAGNHLYYDSAWNVGFGPLERSQLIGTREG